VAGTTPGRKKWRPWVTSSLGRMHRGSPGGKETALSSFMQSAYTANVWKHSKTDTENGDQMSGKVSNESPGRVDTKGGSHALKPLMTAHVLAHVRGTLTGAKQKKSQWNERVSHELLRDDFVSGVRTILHLVIRRAKKLECQYRGTFCALAGSLFVL